MQEFAAQGAAIDFERHGLGEIAFGHAADDAGNFGGGLHEIADEAVDGINAIGPCASDGSNRGALGDAAILSDGLANACEFADHFLVQIENLVQSVSNLTW